MAFVPCLQTIQVELRYLYQDQKIENVLYFRRTAGVGQVHVDACADGLAEWWNDHLRQWQYQWLTMREVYARDLTTQDSYQAWNTTYYGYAGTRTSGEGMPGNVAKAVSFRTGHLGRSARGRNYTCALSSIDVAGNMIENAYAAGILAAYEQLLTPGTYYPSGAYWCTCSRWEGGEQRLYGFTLPITDVILVNMHVDSMRSRLTGRGE
jgi:hypothetical protein